MMLRQFSSASLPRTVRSRPRPLPALVVKVAATAQTTAPRVYKYKDIGAWTSDFDESCWHGFIGVWQGNVHHPPSSTTMQGLRTWRWADSNRRRLDQVNVYSAGRPGGPPPRAGDGLTQIDFHYVDKMVDPDSQEDPVSLDRAAVAAADLSAFAWLSRFWLPPVAIAGPPPPEVLAAARAAEADDANSVQPVRSSSWGMEVFLRDGDCRWSFPLVYDASTGAISRASFIREFATTADPTTPHVLTTNWDVVLPPRPQLPEDGGDDPDGSWLPTHGSVGRRVARLRVAPGGQQLLLDECLEEPVQWGRAKGAAEGGGELMIRLPDAMYVRAPKNIAAPAQMAEAPEAAAAAVAGPGQLAGASSGEGGGGGGGGSSSSVLRFEVGGLLRSPQATHSCSGGGGDSGGVAAVARVVVRYDRVTGSFVDLSHEVFA